MNVIILLIIELPENWNTVIIWNELSMDKAVEELLCPQKIPLVFYMDIWLHKCAADWSW